jgi:hypothetical protein
MAMEVLACDVRINPEQEYVFVIRTQATAKIAESAGAGKENPIFS